MEWHRLAARAPFENSAFLTYPLPGDAEPVLRECLAMRLQKEPDAWTTFNTKSLLGAALLVALLAAGAELLLLAAGRLIVSPGLAGPRIASERRWGRARRKSSGDTRSPQPIEGRP